MNDGLLPIEVAITVVTNNPVDKTQVNLGDDEMLQDIVAQVEVKEKRHSAAPASPVLNVGAVRRKSSQSRRKSRKLTQVCVDSSSSSKVHPTENDRVSNCSSVTATSDSGKSTSSSLKAGPDGKINRIFSMLQMMQQTFLNQQVVEQPQPQEIVQQKIPTTATSAGTITSDPVNYSALSSEARRIHNSMQRRQHLQLDLVQQQHQQSSRKMLYGMGRSQDSLMSSGSSIANKTNAVVVGRTQRIGSVASWASSQCSVLTEGPPPPLVHAMPYHKDGWTSLFIVASSTYAQLLIVICMVAALSEVVTHNVPFLYFEVFFAFLYTVSILFFLYVFGYLLRSERITKEKKRLRKLRRQSNMVGNQQQSTSEEESNHRSRRISRVSMENEIVNMSPSRAPINHRRRFSRSDSIQEELSKSVSSDPRHEKSLQWTSNNKFFDESCTSTNDNNSAGIGHDGRRTKKMKVSDNEHSHGSFFLRVGAVVFGLGTMIYDGLEFGAFMEVPPDSPCFSLVRGFNPLLHAIFVFFQMYFIFVSARLNIHKFKAVARFGLMHCLATNVAVWVRTLVRESLKEINGHYPYYKQQSTKEAFLHQMAAEIVAAVAGNEDGGSSSYEFINDTLSVGYQTAAAPVKSKKVMSLWELTGNVSCGRRIFLGDLIMDAAPFLYPFLIEYSLIGAAVIYVVWAHIGLNPKYKTEGNRNSESIWNSKTRQLRVDCIGASKGLFLGLIFLTATVLCIILFFILTPQPKFLRLGLFLADAAHLSLLVVSLLAMFYGAYRARELHFHSEHMEELGNILLRVSALGIFAYSVFSMIAGALVRSSTNESPALVFVNGLLSVVEVMVQTAFISDMSRRSVSTAEQDREKPGRQVVTFLLITNMALWIVYTFEMQKVEANPVQLNFYGFLPWAIVQRITLPLCIFYRFHAAIVYAEIWKNSYRFHGSSSSVQDLVSSHSAASQSAIIS